MAAEILLRIKHRGVVLTFPAAILLIFVYLRYPILKHDVVELFRSINSGQSSGISNVGDGPPSMTSHHVLGLSDYALDYMPEEVALKLPACTDHKLAADLKQSTISIQGSANRVYRLGDTISVSIQLYNGYGKPLTKGGAILRARMFNMSKQAFATSHVADNGDGSYTAEFEASWTGRSVIKVQINYTPETIRTKYYLRRKLHSTRDIEGIFTAGKYKETTLCHPTWEALRGFNKNLKICNLTGDNSGMTWYCLMPIGRNLLCEDWTGVNTRKPYPILPVTNCEAVLLNRTNEDIEKHLEVDVAEEAPTGSVMISLPNTPCSDFNVTSLWTRQHPTGFAYGNKWHLRHCRGPRPSQLLSCLKNRKFLLLGDSTVRQWYHHFKSIGNCTDNIGNVMHDRMRMGCENREHNFTIQWLPHSQPFFGDYDLIRYTSTSISRHLDETGNDERVIALVHIQMHTISYHHSVFRGRIHRIRASVESLLNRNKFVKVLIKGPHTFTTSMVAGAEVSDFYGLVYRHIWYEEFAGLHDRVIFLDNSDMTNAMAETPCHPSGIVVSAMVEQMLAHIC